ncbi:MAG: hypothetical protein MUO21_06170 [Nitrososphaeraceae archaeon]|nr:hypothetical protein [Nitrososphaeraceae archaeon]
MTKIKRFEDLNEAFNPQKTEVEGQKYNWMSFRLGDVLSDVKLINLNIDDLDDGEDLMLKYYEYPEDVVKTVVRDIWLEINHIATLYFITFEGAGLVHYTNYYEHATWPKNNNNSSVNWFAIQYNCIKDHALTGLSGKCNYNLVKKYAF